MRRRLAVFALSAVLLAATASSSLAALITVTGRTVLANGSSAPKVVVSLRFYGSSGQLLATGSPRSDHNGDFSYFIDLPAVSNVEARAGTGPTYSRVPDAQGMVRFGRIYAVACHDCPNFEDGTGP